MSEKQSGNPLRAPPSFPPPCCPRCFSDRTKFCYYNNYSVSQPRYFCKDCRRYWTHGGALRNIPLGGTNRKRARADFASSSSQFLKPPPSRLAIPPPPSAQSVGCGIVMPAMAATTQSFNGGGGFHQTPGGLLGVNTASFPSKPLFPDLTPLDDFRDFGIPFLQPQQQQAPLPNTNFSSLNLFMSNGRDPTGTANVVSSNDWSEPDDMNIEGDPLNGYKPPST